MLFLNLMHKICDKHWIPLLSLNSIQFHITYLQKQCSPDSHIKLKMPFSSGVSVILSLTFMQSFIHCTIFFLHVKMCQNCISHSPTAIVCFPVGLLSLHVECEFTALSARCICESWGESLTSNKSSERNVAVKSHRQSEVPRKCICHIHEMASGVAAENCHKLLRLTEALPCAKLAITLPLSYWLRRLSLAVTSLLCLTPGCQSGAATCSQHSHRRCDVMVRNCQNRCHFDCRVLQLLWKAGRSVERRTPETWQVVFL